ncbi:MAG TPA: DUF6338 family protein [Solirubrobacterales bacterium]|nr:DUF6338 family protein [Solirubrobacterales bacterium]
MAGSFEALATFALGAIPGIIVLEFLEYGRPQLRERGGARAGASYLLLGLLVWGFAVLCFEADDRLATVLDASGQGGHEQVAAYVALSWRMLVSSVTLGAALRAFLWLGVRIALQVEMRRRADSPRAYGKPGDLVIQAFSFSFAWDRLLERLTRAESPQLVHVRLRDGGDVFGVMAEGGSADFHADGRGLVLDAELLKVGGRLKQMPGRGGVFIASEAVASVAFADYTPAESTTIGEDE